MEYIIKVNDSQTGMFDKFSTENGKLSSEYPEAEIFNDLNVAKNRADHIVENRYKTAKVNVKVIANYGMDDEMECYFRWK